MRSLDREDLRVQRTKEAIRRAFTEMICEMDYEKITIKGLTERARINRKTFYLHYDGLDELLRELQSEMAREFVRRTRDMERPRDMDKITREFFLRNEELGEFGEKLLCSGNYHYISRRITSDILEQTWGRDGERSDADPWVRNIVMTFVTQSTLEIYRQWVADGKKIPLEQMIELTTGLICSGVRSLKC